MPDVAFRSAAQLAAAIRRKEISSHRQLVVSIALVMVAIIFAATPAWPWGCEGHETVALIAEKHLTPTARRAVHDLLEHAPMEQPRERFCRATGLGAMADASTWADDVRSDEHSPYYETGHWHFINVPRRAARRELNMFCPRRRGCVVTAISDQLAVLRAGGADRGRMAAALMFVIHLVADLHQPLHCATNNDLGGNCVPVAYFGTEPELSPEHPEGDVYRPNLHAVWDTDIIRRIMGRRMPAWFADFLNQRFQTHIASWQREVVDLNEWAWESHNVAERSAYGKLPVPVQVETREGTTDCERVAKRILRLHERLGQPYQDAVAPAVEEQLAKAGVRLAMILNQLWQ